MSEQLSTTLLARLTVSSTAVLAGRLLGEVTLDTAVCRQSQVEDAIMCPIECQARLPVLLG